VTQRLDDLDVAHRVVLVRSDLNVPLVRDGDVVEIGDDGRIRASLPTLEVLRERGAKCVILAHLGRPKGAADPALSLAPVARRLTELLGVPVQHVPVVSGPELAHAVDAMAPGDVILAENVRFDARETSKDAGERAHLASEWASWADAYVSDGFGVVHREQASVTEIARLLPSAPGLLVESEVASFDRVLRDPSRPYAVVLGGAKVSDKLAVIGHLLERVDRLIVGGGMAFTFLRAQGLGVGESLLEEDLVPVVSDIMDRARQLGVDIVLPVDVVIAREVDADAEVRIVDADQIPEGWRGLDIGPATAEAYAALLADAGTVVWNGPMGVFELEPFAAGTRRVAEALAACPGFTVVGGGDSVAAIHALGIPEDRFGHISTGGGASLELLEGRTLPGIQALEEAQHD
jgi:phosphoglycerate kinase